MHVGYPYVPLAQYKMSRIVTLQGDGLLFCVHYFRPRLDDVYPVVCLVEHLNRDRLQFVLHRESVSL